MDTTMRDKPMKATDGMLMLLVHLIAIPTLIWALVAAKDLDSPERIWGMALSAMGLVVAVITLCGLFTVAPNQAAVLQLFGNYVGTVRETGLKWANPFYTKNKISLRVRNFETQRLKVNDHDGNPIEIAAVVVWKVVDAAEASFEVDNYENYVHVQSESAVRNLATAYSYDTHEEGVVSLRGSTEHVAGQLKREIEERLAKAGVAVQEARISHLAYAPEIATAML